MKTIPTTFAATGGRTKVIPLINLNGRFDEADLAAHKFGSDPALVLNTAFDDVDDTLNEAWAIGNRVEYDPVDKHFWPSWCRSLSVGDLIVVATDPPRAFAVASVGFDEVAFEDIDIDWEGGRATLANYGHARYRDGVER